MSTEPVASLTWNVASLLPVESGANVARHVLARANGRRAQPPQIVVEADGAERVEVIERERFEPHEAAVECRRRQQRRVGYRAEWHGVPR